MSTIATSHLLTVPEAAKVLRLDRATIYRAISSGRLPAFRVGSEHGPLRIDAEALDAFLRPTIETRENP